jgi:hypothetical protein
MMTESPAPPNAHTIKLKGPWTIIRSPEEGSMEAVIEPRTTHLPADWRSLFGSAAGTAVFERRFNRPTGLTDGHRVRVLFRDVAGLRRVQLNGESLAVDQVAGAVQAVDLTEHMQPHNLLTVEVAFDPRQNADDPGGLWQPVLLQIDEPEDERP